ncbi:hypothetical protein BS50DRAFT_590825 [Corynespora cassiicola Philippines]|uniref:Uncharacterized protein n=1 Tax=Corynespora cassiicola Philippines TaxID=1448308 RepID=A0A2T2NEF3_CORCC|nr:hypothetical protein BS50DRAFT_590825 [Corynespora cassiicola Philippines]
MSTMRSETSHFLPLSSMMFESRSFNNLCGAKQSELYKNKRFSRTEGALPRIHEAALPQINEREQQDDIITALPAPDQSRRKVLTKKASFWKRHKAADMKQETAEQQQQQQQQQQQHQENKEKKPSKLSRFADKLKTGVKNIHWPMVSSRVMVISPPTDFRHVETGLRCVMKDAPPSISMPNFDLPVRKPPMPESDSESDEEGLEAGSAGHADDEDEDEDGDDEEWEDILE